ncbi:uncharacterized protein EHS24_000499 [Apiotrichum porosum]|uniref:TPR-like protein n=1 Tax=Apiotrichum porosum TaxID=105984 RepID=A0A427YA68_9TREE|nr:uncharacterized protein EHS24_000499 [Apiotrichum porosum]RSH87976.1 hypothetical protein EHS24_000499 [Apiotrichum porosum]
MSRALRSVRALSALRAARIASPSPMALARPAVSASAPVFRRYASGPAPVSSMDGTLAHAQSLLDEGTRALEEGDLQRAQALYKESVAAKSTSGGWFNLGVVEYQLENREAAIEAWKQSIQLEPSADAYTNLGSAYMMSRPPQPAEAIKALTAAMEIAPEDPEVAFNLAAVLESTDSLETALTLYRKAQAGGIERAAANVRNVGAKILAKQMREEEANKK